MLILMARGDVENIVFTLYFGEELFTDSVDDIFFTVKDSFNTRKFKFQKRLSTGEIHDLGEAQYELTINPEDTDKLGFGDYDFDIEVMRLPSIKKTFPGVLRLTKEVTHRVNEGVEE